MLRLFKRKIYSFRLVTVSAAFALGFYFSDIGYFTNHPLFGLSTRHELTGAFFITHLGPILVGVILAGVTYTWLPVVFLAVQNYVSAFITNIIWQTLQEFFKEQNRRIAESRLAAEKSRVEKEKRRAEEAAHKAAAAQAAIIQKQRVDEMCGAFSIVVDTSALIDGRMLSLAKNGFLDYPLIVPQCVIDELQHIADNSDKLKRDRGRFGLDVLNDLKKLKTPRVTILSREEVGTEPVVDKRLILLSKRLRAKLLTVDFNLNKAAKASGVKVLNLNELADSVKTILLPGEKLQVKLVNNGKDHTQGVGYLLDGTMIVVESGGDKIGQDVIVEIARVLQTPAGKMFFGRLASEAVNK